MKLNILLLEANSLYFDVKSIPEVDCVILFYYFILLVFLIAKQIIHHYL